MQHNFFSIANLNAIYFLFCLLFEQQNYYDDLAACADIENVRPIYMKIYEESYARRIVAPNHYRNDNYRIIDGENYERTNEQTT